MVEKEFNGYIVLNWKDEDMNLRKTKPSDSKPHEIAVEVDYTVEVPEFDIPKMSEELEVPEVQVKQAASELVDYEEQDVLVDPSEVMIGSPERIMEKIEELEQDETWTGEVEASEKVQWFRSLLRHEYSGAHRSDLVSFLEDKLSEYKEQEADE